MNCTAHLRFLIASAGHMPVQARDQDAARCQSSQVLAHQQ